MVSTKELLSTIESALLGPSPPTPAQRVELLHAIRSSLPAFQSLLSYPPPKPSDRAQVQSREVRLPDSPPISLDDQDVQIALKLSDDLHLNEIHCVRLLVHANQEWGLMGREPLEILRLSAGLWYMERRDLLTALYTLLRAVVLDQGLDADLLCDAQKYLEDLMSSGLRQRNLIGKNQLVWVVLNVNVMYLILEVLLLRGRPWSTGKGSYLDIALFFLFWLCGQITFSPLFSLVIALISDALSAVPDKASLLSRDASFRHEFHEIVMAVGSDQHIERYVDGVRLAWAVHLMLIQDATGAATVSSVSSNDLAHLHSCLEAMLDKVL